MFIDEDSESDEHDIRCPFCNSNAFYRYGKIKTGKQRYLCIICGKQFSIGGKRKEMFKKPGCPKCGSIMYVYRREGQIIRFRCSHYPACRTFLKIKTQRGKKNELLLS
jgi:transposase-like protein